MRAHPMVQRAERAIATPEVEEMMRRLAEYGLGVFMPHMHNEEGFAGLPLDTVQLEGDLKVRFVPRSDPLIRDAAPVGWVWDCCAAKVVSACYCTGAAHNPHWDRPKPK